MGYHEDEIAYANGQISRLLRIMDSCTGELLDFKNVPYLVGPFTIQQAMCEATALVVGKRYDLHEDGTVEFFEEES